MSQQISDVTNNESFRPISKYTLSSLSKLATVRHLGLMSPRGLHELMSIGLGEIQFNHRLLEVEIDVMKTSTAGLGMKNIHSGVSFYKPGMAHPITIGDKMYSLIPKNEDKNSMTLCVFLYFTDYLAYLKLRSTVPELSGILSPDILIINDRENFVPSLVECDLYQQIFFILPNDEVSRVMTMTACQRNDRITDLSSFYRRYNSIFDSLRFKNPVYTVNKCINCAASNGIGHIFCAYLSTPVEDLDNPPCEKLPESSVMSPNDFRSEEFYG